MREADRGMIERSYGRVYHAPDAREGVASLIIARTLAIVLLMATLLGVFIWFAARKSDELSIERQQHVVASVLDQGFETLAHEQEASTVWDDAVERMQASRLDEEWIDNNLGVWFHTYYGHDEIFIADGHDRVVYAMRDGRHTDPQRYARSIGGAVAPLMAELRAKLRDRVQPVGDGPVRSPGAIDVRTVHGHPAIVSVKPIIPESERIVVPPGGQHLHVSIRYLDGSFVHDLGSRYLLAGAHFSPHIPADDRASRVALRTRAGVTVGYFTWQPFRPGTAMLRRLAPALIVSLLLVFATVAWLLRRIGQSTLQLSAARSHALHLANHDPLTSLANRALFDRRLMTELSRLGPVERTLALIYIDLDHFKNVNDHLGHPTGDLLIRALSDILGQLAPDDVVARLGGDEFAIIHVAEDAAASAELLAEDIQRVLAAPINLGDGEVLIGASIGIAVAPADGTDPVDLVRKADIALYDAKRAGRRRHSFFTEMMGARIRERNEIEADLRNAMRTGEGLSVAYQPFFEARSRALVGAEALLRWDHPGRGAMLPDRFVPVAEECGLIETLNEWVLEQACLRAAGWPEGVVSVNLSAVQLRNATLAERVHAILKRTGLAPGRLELEITETSFLETSDRCRENLRWLRDIGVQIALDDFGTGYSSFKHLRGFEIDRIKIDQSFVTAIGCGQPGSPVIQAIVDLARQSGLATTAEGVETEQQRLFLMAIGCDVLQGFLFAQPLSAADLEERYFRGC